MKCLCATTRRAARVLTKFYEQSLSRANITPAQFELLGTILGHPEWKQMELAEDLGLDQTTLSRNLNLLIKRKWIRRVLSSKDRRQTAYEVSQQGRVAFQQALPHWKHAQTVMKEQLGGDWQTFFTAVDRLGTLMQPNGGNGDS